MRPHPRPKQILRFGLTERVYHWAQALPYLVLLGSGGLLLVQRQMQHEYIPSSALILAHRISGLLLPVLLVLVFVLGDTRVLVRNFLSVVLWPLRGLLGLATATLCWLVPPSSTAPPGKFNAGQKLHMLLLIVLIPLFLVSGLYMWFGQGALLPWYLHVGGFLVSTPLVVGHLFLAVVHPVKRKGLSGMFTGKVDADWAREEYGEVPQPAARRGVRS